MLIIGTPILNSSARPGDGSAVKFLQGSVVFLVRMEQKVHSILRKGLKNVREDERDLAMRLLMVIGLKHYDLLYSSQEIQMPVLEYLCGKYVADLSSPRAGSKPRAPAADPASFVRTELGGRQSRPDYMAHYPFADDSGTVPDVLHGPATSARRLLEMGAPARKRLVARVFEEMRFSKVGLRLSDLAEALDRLGLKISADLQKALQSADATPAAAQMASKRQQWNIGSVEGSVSRHVTLDQFEGVVRRILRLVAAGIPLEEVRDLRGGAATDGRRSGGLMSRGGTGGISDEEWSAGEGEGEGEGEAKDDTAGAALGKAESALREARNTSTRMAQRRAQARSRGEGQEDAQYRRELKSVASKIASVVQFDRRRHKEAAARREKKALKTVAQRRVDALTSTAAPVGFRDRHYFSEPRLFHSRPTAHSADLASAVLHKTAPATVTHPNYRRYKDLGTGLATMEIADAFLQGDVGREILSTTESDYRSFPSDDGHLHPESAHRTAELLLGIRQPPQGDARYAPNARYPVADDAGSRNNNTTSMSLGHTAASRGAALPGEGRLHAAPAPSDNSMRIVDYAAPVTVQSSHRLSSNTAAISRLETGDGDQYEHRSASDKRVESQLNESAKRLYEAPGWRSSTGGWVADFGPPHTHSLYTGPEVDYDLARARKTTGHAVPESASDPLELEPKPWTRSRRDPAVVSSRHSSSATYSADHAPGSPEAHMARALRSSLEQADDLRWEHERNEAAIDSMIMRVSGGAASATAMAAAASASNALRTSRSDAALWEIAFSEDSNSPGAAAGAGAETRLDASTCASQGRGGGGSQGQALGTLQPRSQVKGAARDGDSDSSASSFRFEGQTAAELGLGLGAGHYNPYAAEDSSSSGGDGAGILEEPSGDDAEFAAAMDESISLSAAVRA